jgi:Cof subfamily protein (haloacid dehalogenase superfamily)
VHPATIRPRTRLLALDVDGTLLRSDGSLAARTRDALRAADGAGWHVALVTGRPLPHALPLARELGIGEFVVAANGATIGEVTSGAVLEQSSLAGHVVREAVALARGAFPGLRLAVTTPRGLYAEPGFAELAPLTRADTIVVDDASPLPDDTVYSTLLFAHGAHVGDLLRRVEAVVGEDVHVTPAGLPGSIELTPPGVHKGSGVARLCERIGVAQTDVVAFGDGLNDLEMLAWAGCGVAMANADHALAAIADEVTASNDDDGVAVVVERLLARDSS